MNNAIGASFFNAEDMNLAAQDYKRECEREGMPVNLENEINEYGWYSSEILSYVFRWKIARHELGSAMQLTLDATNPVTATPDGLDRLQHIDAVGLVVNIDNPH